MSTNPYAPPGAPVDDAPVPAGPLKILNPWLSMWTEPRATIAQIVERPREDVVLLLAAVSGFGEALDRASMRSAGDTLSLPAIFGAAALGGAVGGVLTLFLGSWLLRWTGSWIGGKASSEHIRTAMAWSSVPLIWGLLLWIPELAIFGSELFKTTTPRVDANVALALSFAAIEIVVGVWSFVVFLKSLGQVQGFSAWKALGNGALAVLVIVVPIVLLVLGLRPLLGGAGADGIP